MNGVVKSPNGAKLRHIDFDRVPTPLSIKPYCGLSHKLGVTPKGINNGLPEEVAKLARWSISSNGGSDTDCPQNTFWVEDLGNLCD